MAEKEQKLTRIRTNRPQTFSDVYNLSFPKRERKRVNLKKLPLNSNTATLSFPLQLGHEL
jgi:hypothetical protein